MSEESKAKESAEAGTEESVSAEVPDEEPQADGPASEEQAEPDQPPAPEEQAERDQPPAPEEQAERDQPPAPEEQAERAERPAPAAKPAVSIGARNMMSGSRVESRNMQVASGRKALVW